MAQENNIAQENNMAQKKNDANIEKKKIILRTIGKAFINSGIEKNKIIGMFIDACRLIEKIHKNHTKEPRHPLLFVYAICAIHVLAILNKRTEPHNKQTIDELIKIAKDSLKESGEQNHKKQINEIRTLQIKIATEAGILNRLATTSKAKDHAEKDRTRLHSAKATKRKNSQPSYYCRVIKKPKNKTTAPDQQTEAFSNRPTASTESAPDKKTSQTPTPIDQHPGGFFTFQETAQTSGKQPEMLFSLI